MDVEDDEMLKGVLQERKANTITNGTVSHEALGVNFM
jgi:hypothetical protein